MLLFAGGDRPGRPGGRQGGDRASLGSRGALPAVRSEAITGGSIPKADLDLVHQCLDPGA